MVELNLGEATFKTTTSTTAGSETTSLSHAPTGPAGGSEATSFDWVTDDVAGHKEAECEIGDRQENEFCTTVFRCAIRRDLCVGQFWFTGIWLLC